MPEQLIISNVSNMGRLFQVKWKRVGIAYSEDTINVRAPGIDEALAKARELLSDTPDAVLTNILEIL